MDVVDFGDVALAGAFLRKDQFAREERFPLRVVFCESCMAVQVADSVDPKALFVNYFYYSSAIGTLREHFTDYASEVVSRFLDPSRALAVEIGCNDGVLAKPLADHGVRTVIGVDPATNIVQSIDDPRINVVNDFFSPGVADDIVSQYGKADLVVANNVFAHIPDIRGATEGVRRLLADDGVFVVEVHYLGGIMSGYQYDMIYHEHLYNYSLLALENHLTRFGLSVFDVKRIPIHGGSMRYYIAHAGSSHASGCSPRVEQLRRSELAAGFDKAETYRRFASDISVRRDRLMDLLERLRKKGLKVAGYGASGRANTIIQYCGIDHTHMSYMIDDAPAKHGFYTPGSHYEIRSRQALVEDRPDYLLLFAWTYFSEIADKCANYLDGGGRMIVPLPDVRLVLHPTHDLQL